MMDRGHEWGIGDWFVMTAVMVLFWGGLIAILVWLVRDHRNFESARPSTDRADALLAERFVRGEIDGEEFIRERTLIHADPTQVSPNADRLSP
ncbi:MAG TPA: hypothetical protein VH419_12720 [Nocardioidaceae bacterium]